MPLRILLVIAVALLAVPSWAAAKSGPPKRADLLASSLRVPAHAHPGGPVTLDVTVRAKHRAAAKTATRFYLSADRRKGRGDVRLARAATPKLKRNARHAAIAQATLPAGTKLRSWYVLACADDTRKVRERSERNNCTTAKLSVAAKTATPSTQQLIEADLKAGRLSAEKALTYRVFSEFADRRLPARYRGDAGAEADHDALREVAAAFATLTPKAKRDLRPFFLPPPARHSWANLPSSTLAPQHRTTPENTKTKAKPRKRKRKRAKASTVTARAAQAETEVEEEFVEDPCDADQLVGKQWGSTPAAGGKIRIWWLKDNAKDAAAAPKLAQELGGVAYPKFKAAMGRDLVSDDKIECFHGSDGALDVYLIPSIAKGRAMSIPSAQTPQNNLICDGTPSFIVAESGSGPPPRWDLAHELFHSFQFLFPMKEDCRNYLWFDEGSANWGANLAFPEDDGEHRHNYLLSWATGWSLNDLDYPSWTFALFLEKTVGTQAIKAIYEEFGRADALPAMDKAIGGFRKRWKEFAKHAWNRAPVASFTEWDRIPEQPTKNNNPMEPVHLHLAGQKQRTAYPKADMSPLARDYHWFTVTDDTLRELRFVNPAAGDEDFGVQAIVTVGGQRRVEDWTGKKAVTFCRDTPGQDVTELVLIYSNAKYQEGQSINAEPNLKLRDECEGFPYRYKVLSSQFRQYTTAQSTDVGVCDAVGGLRGSNEFTGTLDAPQLDAENVLKKDKYGFEGQVYADVPATWFQTLHGCEITPDPDTIPCSTTHTSNPKPDGRWKVGFSIRAYEPDAQTMGIHWTILDPSVGFVDPDNSVCNFSELWKGLDYDVGAQQVPLEKLASTAPQTYTFTGGPMHWNATQIGRPATIGFDWSHSITIQRVDAEGQPLQ